MLNEFRIDQGEAAGLWRDKSGLAHPTMLVLLCESADVLHNTFMFRYDYPVVAIHQIRNMADCRRKKDNAIKQKYLKGHRFVSYEIITNPGTYVMIVYVEPPTV